MPSPGQPVRARPSRIAGASAVDVVRTSALLAGGRLCVVHRATTVTLGAAIALVSPTAADGADGIRQRTLILWSDIPCMTVVERDVDPVVPLRYAVEKEDTGLTPDEVATGRRHQMIGFCRQHSPQAPLPTWLSWADVDDAAGVDLVDPDDVEPYAMLEDNPEWTDCVVRVIADADRRPITNAAAAEPVLWDTTGLPAGGWAIEGYTWDPPFNIWSPRPGVVAVFDDAGGDNAPVAGILSEETIVFAEDTAPIEGCVIAGEGSTFTAQWSETVRGDLQVWAPLVVDEPVEGTSFSFDFVPPEAAVGTSANIRVQIVDASGRSTIAYRQDAITVLPGGGDGPSCDEGGGFVAAPGCGTSSTGGEGDGETTASTGEGDTSSDSAPAADGEGDGRSACACSSTPSADGIFGLLLLAGWRRPRRR